MINSHTQAWKAQVSYCRLLLMNKTHAELKSCFWRICTKCEVIFDHAWKFGRIKETPKLLKIQIEFGFGTINIHQTNFAATTEMRQDEQNDNNQYLPLNKGQVKWQTALIFQDKQTIFHHANDKHNVTDCLVQVYIYLAPSLMNISQRETFKGSIIITLSKVSPATNKL